MMPFNRASLKVVGLSALLATGLTGCSFYQSEVVLAPSNKVTRDLSTRDNALVNLALPEIAAQSSDLPPVSLNTLRDQYNALMPMVEALTASSDTELTWRGELSQDIQNRLADIEMLLAEEADADGADLAEGRQYYAVAIEAYEQLLADETTKGQPLPLLAKENILYQLARAHSLQGNDERAQHYATQLLRYFPNSDFASELYFRIGEGYYNDGDYAGAISAYGQVINPEKPDYLGYARPVKNDTFYTMSAYMKAWSHFKLEEYFRALDAFMLMLDASLQPDNYAQLHKPLDDLNLSEQKLVEDALAMSAVMLQSQGGARAVNDYFAFAGEKGFTYLVYDEMAQSLLDDSQFRQSADIYLAFATQYPLHAKSIDFFIKHIDAYILGDFPSDVLPAKQRFVEAYGLNGPYWQGFTAEQSVQAMPYIVQYLKELAQFEHALGQQSIAALATLEDDATEERKAYLIATRDTAYQNAERWYREFIETFGPGRNVADMQFYLAESLFEIERFADAVTEYEAFAYTFTEHPEASNAAYSALLALMRNPEQASLNNESSLTRLQQSQMRFLQQFGNDARAVDVGVTLAQTLYDNSQYLDAITWSEWLLAKTINADTTRTALLVLAQSQFELRDYAGAQTSYQTLLSSMSAEDPLRPELTDKLAATFYQQAQQFLAMAPEANEQAISPERARLLRAAVEQLTQIMVETPSSPVAINAQYDAATYLMQLSDWAEAIPLMLDFEQRYPANPLTKSLAERIIVAYENSGQWLLASDRLQTLWAQDKQSEKGREALYLSAEYADKAERRDIALPLFRTYAHQYTSPLSQANEARFTLSQYYLDSGEDSKRRFWLNKMIEADVSAGAERSDRSRYLAAMSKTVFADDAFYVFERIKLTLPLNESIQKKRNAMQSVIEINQAILEYKVAEFTTKAGYRLGEVYALLATALYDSERPDGLDELALEQYDILLEEQAYPFEEQAIAIHETNAQRSWQGVYDEWVALSFTQLASLLPAKYNKKESKSEVNYDQY